MKTVNETVIRALSRALMEARAGNVAAVAIVTASPEGAPEVSFGGESELVPSLNLAFDMLKLQLVQVGIQATALPASGLVRPATGAKLDG